MPNTFQWYICPYDVGSAPGGGIGRIPGIARYIPATPNPDDAKWSEAEILGNHIVVKVFAPASVHTTIQADPDFTRVPLEKATITGKDRVDFEKLLEDLPQGYTKAELSNTSGVVTQYLTLLTTAVGVVEEKPDMSGHEVKPGRRVAGKTVAKIEQLLPG